ncbi:hypothetical protein A3766_24995 [Oleiphilus sp. HI0132]|uniref:ATP-binding cassette domain-containing protein n=1 Tax=Oleiphilus sp. HI0132 TaxID=1822270 RepID=UPI0007C3B6DC|nr:hypothetical protein A3766_24995 [Oleiphilus sp. HI0132]
MKTLKAENLAKAYDKRQIVKDVSLTINSGEVIGLLGPNGAGKTTCFYMIVGLVKHDKGKISVNDTDLSSMAMHDRARNGVGIRVVMNFNSRPLGLISLGAYSSSYNVVLYFFT